MKISEDERSERIDVELKKLDKVRADHAAHVINSLPPGAKYLIRVKFVDMGHDLEKYIDDKIDPILMEKGKKDKIVFISNTSRPGMLVGIDNGYNHAYAVGAVVYGLYLIREPNLSNLLPLKDGDLNCVARRIIEHFEGAARGQKLTPAKHNQVI